MFIHKRLNSGEPQPAQTLQLASCAVLFHRMLMPIWHIQISKQGMAMTDLSVSVPAASAIAPATPSSRLDSRVQALDGLRGLATVMVVVSHYFGEVPHGIAALMVGWIAVDIFFVLSGYLVGKLILERKHCSNFFAVFYVRRICRTFPSYMIVASLVYLMFALSNPPQVWMQYVPGFSLWSYLTFTQNFQMAFTGEIGPYWLGPYWTLAVEEHFYLIGPAFLVFAPKRWMVPVLGLFAVLAVVFRLAIAIWWSDVIIADALLPGRMDTLILGIFAAIMVTRGNTNWAKLDYWLRVVPLIALLFVICLQLIDASLTRVFGHAILGFGAAAFILMLVRGLPESIRFNSKYLGFFAEISYATYLTHIAVLGCVHGLLLGTAPDIATPVQFAVTMMALPVCFTVGWLITRFIEAPISAYGRTWKWREPVHVNAA
jgi:peptidoglycan/LPS O-acetylase OafA/YrhL